MMRIVSWNCHYGFTEKKLETIQKFDADVLVVQECSEKDWKGFLKEKLQDKYGSSSHWFGDGKDSDKCEEKNLGILVLCKEGLKPEKLYEDNDVKSRYVLPYKIGGRKDLTLFAVWTKGKDGNGAKYKDYHEPVFLAMEDKVYSDKISKDKSAILIGDFNTGSVECTGSAHWYKDLKSKFSEKHLFNCAGSQEWTHTFFRGNGSFLDDHCFATESLYSKLVSFGIGNSDYWRQFSDHCPIIIDFDF
jgi:endonuclease/exonuclease/phosphatase family metal-dependent hydrolase